MLLWLLLGQAATAGTQEPSLAPVTAAATTTIALSLLLLLLPLESGKKDGVSLPATFQSLPCGDGMNLTRDTAGLWMGHTFFSHKAYDNHKVEIDTLPLCGK